MPDFRTRLSISAVFATACLAAQVQAQLGAPEQWQCGNTETPMDRLITKHIVPDVFPPNNYMSAYVAPSLMGQGQLIAAQECAAIAVANWSPACTRHDVCMEARGANGKSSETCNDEILAGWTNACAAAYQPQGLGTATTTGEAWSQVFAPFSGGNNSSTYSADITKRIFCQAACVQMAKASYIAMKTNTSDFTASTYVPITYSPFQGTSQTSPFIAEVLGVAKEAQSNVLAAWTDAGKTVFQLTLKVGYWIKRYIPNVNLDDDYLFGYSFEEGDFSVEATVTGIVLELHDDYGKAGLAIRNNSEIGSTSAELVIVKNGKMIFRTHASGGTSEEISLQVSPSLPMNLKLTRLGKTILASYKIGAGSWTAIGSRTLDLKTVVKAGLCVPYGIDYSGSYTTGYWTEPHNAAFFKSVIKKRIPPIVPALSMLLLD